MVYLTIDDRDRELIAAAKQAIEKNYDDPRHTVGAAVLCSSGCIYTGVNIESCGYGPCAEPIAIGCAISNGERDFKTIVAIGGSREPHTIVSPCGNCRQLLYDYAPDCMVILLHDSKIVKVKARELIPDPYGNFEQP